MEEDNFKPDCDNIKRNIKSFTEDMLKEDEYKAFLHHLETCSECKNYVRSVDSFSNQLWRLGDIKVPSDFSSTVLFRLTQPDEEPDEEEEEEVPATSKKLLIGGITFLLVAMTIAAGLIGYLKLRQPPEEEAVVAQVEEVAEEAVGEYLGELEGGQLELYDDSDAPFEGVDESIAFEWTGDIVSDETAKTDEVSLGPKLVHWHFLHYNKTKELESLRLRRKKRSKESDLRKQNVVVEPESGEEKKSVIEGLQEEIRQIEVQLEQNLTEKRRRESEPLGILKSSDIRPDYQDSDFIFFSTSGDGLRRVLDEIALIFPDSSSLDDFTPGMSHLPHKKYQVSVYIVKKETAIMHWHVHLSMINQKLQLLKTIQESGGVITYEFAEEVTISIASSKIANVKAQMPAMRISLSEYGNQVATGEENGDESAVISIYFSK